MMQLSRWTSLLARPILGYQSFFVCIQERYLKSGVEGNYTGRKVRAKEISSASYDGFLTELQSFPGPRDP